MATRTDQSQLIELLEVTSTGEVIGKGSYGRVIKVYVHGTLCAAKEVHAILLEGVTHEEYETTKQSFLTECVNASRIHHPNVVQVLGIHYPTPEAKLPWLVMEMMQCSVKGFMQSYKKDTIPLHFKLSILVDISQGLEFLHGQDIIHRDLSSNNVLLTKHCVAKIADLGVAKVIKHNKMRTQTQTPGTLHFMPPETLTSKPRYGKPVDVFSLGCVACHVMSHQWPEPKDLFPEPDSLTARTEIQRREDYLSSCSYSSLKQLVESCLKNVPEQRSPISSVCRELKDLKTTVDKQIPFATANNIELFDAVRLGKVEIARLKNTSQVGTLQGKVKKLTDELAIERNAVEAAQLQVETLEAKVKKLTDELTIERNAAEDAKNQLDGTLSELQYVRNDKHRLELQMMVTLSQVETLKGKIKELTDELATKRGAVKAAMRKPHVYEDIPGLQPPLTTGSLVQCGGNPIRYGVVKWIGYLPGGTGEMAGVELDYPMRDSVNNDGAFAGIQYYDCRPGYGLFVHATALQPDLRFPGSQDEKATKPANPLRHYYYEHDSAMARFVRAPIELDIQKHIGIKGIQGQQNSCYIDATLYGMFAFSEVFDGMFLEKKTEDPIALKIKATLERNIINPLRIKNVVVQDAILELQNELSTLNQMMGHTWDEKDPEEFLNLLFKRVLHVDPFLVINRPSGTDKEFFVQLFVEPDRSVSMPETYWALHKMFMENEITFKEHPQRLLLQVPRYGKKYSLFDRVKPTLKLVLNTLCADYAEPCYLCGRAGKELCYECSQLTFWKEENGAYFCKSCSQSWHSHPDRKSHKSVPRDGNDEGHELELLSVLCIETSHYVCFTRITGSGKKKDQWVFFDSMATRTDDEYNLPRVVDCTDDINNWVYGDKDISKIPLKELPELVRQFVGDPYLCIYTERGGDLYG